MTSQIDSLDPSTNYKVKSLIAEGSRSRVYLAEDSTNGKQLAVKFLRQEEFPENDTALSHIKHESLCLTLSAHTNVVANTGHFINPDGRPYLVTEYLAGKSLKQIYETTGTDSATLLNIIMQLTHALENMHKVGVLHLDLRPDKIIILQDKKGVVPKLIGFGRAGLLPWSGREKLVDPPPKGSLYSLQYISPEQAMDKRPLPASDVYSLACIFYEGLVGKAPIQGENELHLMAQHLSGNVQAPSIAKADSKLKKFDHAIMQAMAKETHMRFVDAAEFREDLSHINANSGWMAKLFNK